MGKEDPEYYPFRWKFADAVEDLFVLHRRKLIAGTLLLLGAVAVVVMLMNGDNDVETTEPPANQSSTPESTDSVDTVSTTAPSSTDATNTSETSSSASSSPTTTSTTTSSVAPTSTETTVQQSTRPVPTPEEIAAAQPGAIIEMTPGSIRLVGGLPSDVAANDTIRVVEQVFPGAEVLDQQIVDSSFPVADALVFRLSAADLFGYNSDVINETYLPLIDQLAATMVDADIWQVEVSGHTDSSGEAPGNQRLSERRAQAGADRLVAQGVDGSRISVVGEGETKPIADNGTDAGQLANRRIEFRITEN